MGSGASTEHSNAAEHSKVHTESKPFSKSALDEEENSDMPLFSQDLESTPSSGTDNGPKLSATKLKKMAIGQQSYKDKHRDYDASIADIDFNKPSVITWSATEPTPITKMSTHKPTTPIHNSQDLRASGGRGSGQRVGPPPFVVKPPPPRRVSNTGQVAAASSVATTTSATSSTSSSPYQPVIAPSKLPPPTAATDAPPLAYSTYAASSASDLNRSSDRQDAADVLGSSFLPKLGSAQHSPRLASSGIRPQHQQHGDRNSANKDSVESFKMHRSGKTKGKGGDEDREVDDDDDDDDADEDGGEVYDWIAQATMGDYDVSASLAASNTKVSDTHANSAQVAKPTVNTVTKPGNTSSSRPTPTPTPTAAPTPVHDASRNIPIRPFPRGQVEADDDLMATFTSVDKVARDSDRPAIVPSLAIPSQNFPAGSSTAVQSILGPKLSEQQGVSQSTKPAPPKGKPSAMDTMGGASLGAPSTTASPMATGMGPVKQMPGMRTQGGRMGMMGSGGPNTPTSGLIGGPPTGPVAGRGGPRPSPPPKGAMHAVKETHDVKRNRAQLPSTLMHMQPTTGDWLKKRYIVNNYILLDTLGVGSYGEVRLCKDRTTDALFAIKIISKEMLKKKKGGNTSETYFEDIKREIAIMKKLLHPNVLRLFEVLDDPNVNKMYLVLEYMKRGDLLQVLKDREKDEMAAAAAATMAESSTAGVGIGLGGSAVTTGATSSMTSSIVSSAGGVAGAGAGAGAGATSGAKSTGFSPLSDLELWNIFRQLTAGIRYLHYQNIVHGDIKPQNLLVGEDGVVKIADFGISKMLQSGEKLTNAAGTPAFMSPELCAGEAFSGQLADVWAMGATMFMLCFGHPPFIASNIMSLYYKIQNDELVFPMHIEGGLKDLLTNMLVKDPAKRFTLQQVIMHPWMRQPPAPAKCSISAAAAAPSSAASIAAAVDKSSSVSTSTDKSVRGGTTGSNTAASLLSPTPSTFVPPPSYDKEEAAAMQAPINTVAPDELFQSIGVGATKAGAKVKKSGDEDLLEEGEETDEEVAAGGAVGTGDRGDKDENIMATKWGADVFEMVEGGDDSDTDDEVDDDEEVDDSPRADEKKKMNLSSKGAGEKHLGEKLGSADSLVERSEMSKEEQQLRAQRFQKHMTKKSMENLKTTKNDSGVIADNTTAAFRSIGGNCNSAQPSSREGPKVGAAVDSLPSSPVPRPTKLKISHSNFDGSPIGSRQDAKANAVASPKSQQQQHRGSSAGMGAARGDKGTPQQRSTASTPSHRLGSSVGSASFIGYEDEETDELSMDDFAKLMDTLAMQPKQAKHDEPDDAVPVPITLKPAELSAQLRNSVNNVGAAFHSEQGRRHSQEDRCILLADVGAMRALEGYEFDEPDTKSSLSRFSLACVFDGHSGWRCAEYLSQHLAPLLVTHPKFLEKQPDAAIMDVFSQLDEEICELLRGDSDSSGSTATLALYDGRRHVLTVATVGDSMCVLSRGGRAVKVLRMHRLDNEEERLRVEKAGGTVVNSRVNGILAVSRAFGDTQFKGADGDTKTGPVVATPDISAEVITPMTEFAIVASDGLWDVLSPQSAVNCVRKKLAKKSDLQGAAQELVQEALNKGSVDNVTVLIMSFHMTPGGPADAK